MQITVIIPSYNSEKTIFNCLNSLLNQTLKEGIEIILADSSDDETPAIVKKHFPTVNLIHFNKKTDPGTARNAGVKMAIGEIILFTDSDCIVEKNWIEKMITIHKNFPELAGVGGSIENGNKSSDQVAWAGYMAEFRENIPQQKRKYIWHNPTCNISYKAWVFIDDNLFDPRLYPQEDLVFNYNLIKSGYKILFEPDIKISHVHRSSFGSYLRHQKRFGIITAKVLRFTKLPGSGIAKNKILFCLIGYLLPFVKFFKTVYVFLTKNPKLLIKHPFALIILKIGLVYWYFGFVNGVMSKGFDQSIIKKYEKEV